MKNTVEFLISKIEQHGLDCRLTRGGDITVFLPCSPNGIVEYDTVTIPPTYKAVSQVIGEM